VTDAPSSWSGSVFHIERDKMRFVDITQKDAMSGLKTPGYGTGVLLKGKL